MSNILITGAHGQLGSEIQAISADHPGHNYYFTDVDTLDITDKAAILRYAQENNINVIVNCAAYTAVDNAEDNQEAANLINHLAPGQLAEVAQQTDADFIHISTDYVFNGTNHTPYKEEEPTCPASVYGSTKLAGEELVMKNCEKALIIRTAWLYSSFGNNFVKTMLRLGRERNALGVIFDQVGTPTYARDLAQAIMAIINHGLVGGIYHYSNEGVCSWYDFTKTIHRIAGITTCKVSPLHTDEYPTKAARPHYSVLDKTKIKQTFGIEIPHWEESLQQCLKELL